MDRKQAYRNAIGSCNMKIFFLVTCLLWAIQCGPIGDFHIIKQVDPSTVSSDEEQVPLEEEPSSNPSGVDQSTTDETASRPDKDSASDNEMVQEDKESDPNEVIGEPNEALIDDLDSDLVEYELSSGRMLLGGDSNIFDEENIGCADGELKVTDHEEDLDLELKVNQESDFSILLENVCGLDYEGARILISDKSEVILYDFELEIGQTDYRFPPEGFTVTLGVGIYDVKMILGRKERRGPFGVVVLGQDIDSISVGAIKVSLASNVAIYGDFTSE